jgi:putative hydrolase of the HAD superfamily
VKALIKAVLFDLDGTLLDRDASLAAFIDAQYERLIHWVGHIPKEEYTSRFIELDNRGYVWKDKVYEQLIAEYGIQGISQEELLQDYVDKFKNHCMPFPHLFELLDELKRRSISIGLITNGQGQFQLNNVKALGIERYFDAILISEWEGVKKPDAKLFHRALNRLQVVPFESVFVGDHPENDVKAAQSIGMKAIWKRDRNWHGAESDGVIGDLLDTLEFIIAEKPCQIKKPSGFFRS